VATQALMAFAQWLAGHIGVALGAGLGGFVRMPLVARSTLLMRGRFPGVGGRHFTAMTRDTRRTALRLAMHPMAARTIGMMTMPRLLTRVAIVAHQLRSTRGAMLRVAFRAAVVMRTELGGAMTTTADILVRCELMW